MNNNKIKELEAYVEAKWNSIKQLDEAMKFEEKYEGKVSEETKQFKELAIARWATADRILLFLTGAEDKLIDDMEK